MFPSERKAVQMGEDGRALVTVSADETRSVARELGADMRGGDLVMLRGPLGAGKSVFARGIAEALGIVSWRGSPTFTLINEYASMPRLVHVDLYRLSEGEARDLGLEEYVDAGVLLVVEWADRAREYLLGLGASREIEVDLAHGDGDARAITIRTVGLQQVETEAC
jgi:tRNA threonylcarbamoyladenosine biosynthesis protein TsaE